MQPGFTNCIAQLEAIANKWGNTLQVNMGNMLTGLPSSLMESLDVFAISDLGIRANGYISGEKTPEEKLKMLLQAKEVFGRLALDRNPELVRKMGEAYLNMVTCDLKRLAEIKVCLQK